jgi:hypothetical protein
LAGSVCAAKLKIKPIAEMAGCITEIPVKIVLYGDKKLGLNGLLKRYKIC